MDSHLTESELEDWAEYFNANREQFKLIAETYTRMTSKAVGQDAPMDELFGLVLVEVGLVDVDEVPVH